MTRAEVARVIGQAEVAGAKHLAGILQPVTRGAPTVFAPMQGAGEVAR